MTIHSPVERFKSQQATRVARLLPALIGTILGTGIAAFGQDLPTIPSLFDLKGSLVNNHWGTVVGGVGDADGDGRPDLLVGSDSQLTIVSGATGRTLYTLSADRTGEFARATAFPVGDLDGDGRPEIVVAAPFADPGGMSDAGSVFVFSGATGRLLRRVPGPAIDANFGASAALLGDLDGDGIPELVVGAPGASPDGRLSAGSVAVVSLADGRLVHSFENLVAGERLGTSVAALGDISGDGRPDFAVGAPASDIRGLTDSGFVLGISPADAIDRRNLFLVAGLEAGYEFGSIIAVAGDRDGDGRTDLLIGAPGRSVGDKVAAGTLFTWSTGGRQILSRLEGVSAGDRLGSVIATGGDFDGDGRADILVGMPLADVAGRVDAGRVEIYSGVDGRSLARFRGETGDQLGAAVAFVGDVNSDGKTDVIVGAPFSDPLGLSDAGSAAVLSGGSDTGGTPPDGPL